MNEPVPNTVASLRNTPLPEVLTAIGAERDRYDKARWHTPRGVISVTGMKFFNWTCSTGGGGAIDLVIHVYGLPFKGAVEWLGSRFTGRRAAAACAKSQATLQLPAPEVKNLPQVKHYLTVERRISPAVIDYLVWCGDLYADGRRNAVFLMRTMDKVPAGAELRGTGPNRWRGMAHGSRRDRGYFSIRDVCTDAVILCESAIDAISCFMLNPHCYCLSTAGARPAPRWLAGLIRSYPKVYCGFDADPAGDTTATAMIKAHPCIKRLRPEQHDWNEMLRSQR
jgi:hypothetical protein